MSIVPIDIKSKAISSTITLNTLSLLNMTVVPFNNATIQVKIDFTESSGLLDVGMRSLYKVIELTNLEYANWVSDDYLIDLVLSKLNLDKP